MMLIPASQRPYVGDTAHNSWWELIFEANGLDRVGSSGLGGPGGGFGGGQGALRLFNAQIGGQIAWLLPLAALGLITGLWVHRRAPRTDPARATYVLWGIWAIVHVAVFSFSLNLLHPYYTSALAPAVAVLAAGGMLALWDRARTSRLASATLAGALIATAALSVSLLGRTPSFVPWLRWTVLAMAVLCAAAILLRRARARTLVLPLALAAVLAAPAAYSIATVGRSITGANPTAGPAGAAADGFPGGHRLGLRLFGATGAGGGASSELSAGLGQGLGIAGAGPAGAGGGRADRRLIAYLESHRGRTRYLVAASGSMTAAPIILATHQLVITIGGFSGQDPAPTVAQLERLISSGRLRYVLGFGRVRAPIGLFGRGRIARGGFGLPGGAIPGSGIPGGAPSGGAPSGAPPAGGPPGAGFPGGGFRGFPGFPGGPGGVDSAAQSRQRWVVAHCKPVSGYSGLEDCSAAR